MLFCGVVGFGFVYICIVRFGDVNDLNVLGDKDFINELVLVFFYEKVKWIKYFFDFV